MTDTEKAVYDRIELTWHGLNVTVESKQDNGQRLPILQNCSGYARAGRICSIMGPSGAGKTTMVDLLAGRLQNAKRMSITGEVLINDKPIDHLAFRKASAYVQQEDHLPPTETVRECLMFSAQLRLPGSLSKEDQQARVDGIIDELSLRSCADTLVGSAAAGIKGISGGEKRRASVGMELVTSPSCIFLDEPTSGLDSEIAVNIMRTLQQLAAAGRTVLLTIHQPNSDITELFDDFIMMAGGRVVYGGPWADAVDAFAAAGYQCPQYKNPTDYFMKIATDSDAADKLIQQQDTRWTSTRRAALFADNPAAARGADAGADGSSGKLEGVQVDDGGGEIKAGKLAVMDTPDSTPSSPLYQLWVLCRRQGRAWRRHPIMLVGEGVQYIFLAFFVGGLFFDVSSGVEDGIRDRAAAGFFILVCIAFTPPFTVITVWQDERKLVRREVNQNVYSLSTFFWSKTCTVFPFEFAFVLLVSLITYFMYGFQHDAGKFFIFFAAMALAQLISESIGMLFAMMVATADLAIVFLSIVFILLLALTGFITTTTPVYYDWIGWINFLRYANSIILRNELSGLKLTGPGGSQVDALAEAEGSEGSNSLIDLSIGGCFGVLIGMLVLVRGAALLALHLAYRLNWL